MFTARYGLGICDSVKLKFVEGDILNAHISTCVKYILISLNKIARKCMGIRRYSSTSSST